MVGLLNIIILCFIIFIILCFDSVSGMCNINSIYKAINLYEYLFIKKEQQNMIMYK